jgi:hypothetical protein
VLSANPFTVFNLNTFIWQIQLLVLTMLLPSASSVWHQPTSSLFNISQPQAFSATTNHSSFQQQPTSGLLNITQPQAFSTTTNHESFQQKSTSGLVSTSQPQAFSTKTNHGSFQQQPSYLRSGQH